MSKEAKKILQGYKEDIEPILEEFFAEKCNSHEGFNKLFFESLCEFTLRGGKRLRPALMYYTFKSFSKEDSYEVKKVSVFLELIQSFLLIHDDIMDKSKLRRGGKTTHKIFEEYSSKNGYNDTKHFGNSMAILNGDLACLLAYEIINSSSLDEKVKTELTTFVSQEISKVIFGQIQDILLEHKSEYTQGDILEVHENKTAVYTFRLPMLSGALVANASKEEMDILDEYAMSCGVAFQIRDDILGVFGTEKTLGKETTSDISENKKTFLTSYAYEKANNEQKEIMDSILGKANLEKEEVEKFKQVIEETGSLQYSIEKSEQYVKKAKTAIKKLGNEKDISFLNSIADYLLVRDQ